VSARDDDVVVHEPIAHSPPPSGANVALWCGVLMAPVAVLGGESAAYVLVPDACARQSNVFIHLVHLVVLLVVLAGFAICWRAWTGLGRREPGDEAGPDGRARYMAFSGLLENGFFALVVLAMWLATWLFSPCSA
jgi:hypothetical protein